MFFPLSKTPGPGSIKKNQSPNGIFQRTGSNIIFIPKRVATDWNTCVANLCWLDNCENCYNAN